MPQGLSFDSVVADQQGLSRDQLAAKAQAATLPAAPQYSSPVYGPSTPVTTPAPTVLTSAPAREATGRNLTTLTQAETQLTGQQTSPLQSIYSNRADLQALYNPDGTAKNAADPKIAGIPTLQDWAAKYGINESPSLKAYTSSNPALAAMMTQINQTLANGGTLTPEQRELFNSASTLGTQELKTLSSASTAASTNDHKTLNDYMTQLEEIRTQQQDYISKLFESMKQTDQEKQLTGQINDITNQERNLNLRAEAGMNETAQKQIPLKFITGEQTQILRDANLQLQTLAAEKAPLIDQLTLAQTTRQSAVDALKATIQYGGDDANMVSKLAEYATQLEETHKTEQETAKTFALENNITEPFYSVGGTVYRVSDGKAYSTPEQAAADGVDTATWKNVQNVTGGAGEEKALVMDLASKYADAGILPTDSLPTAQSKLSRSRIYQDQVRGPVGSGSGSGGVLGLTNQQIDNISPLVTQFQNSPIVKNYNVLGEAQTFVNSLSNSTNNPIDDQALIYSVAKALDPDSVVREGEYATVQKYAQSWAKAYGKSVEQAFLGSGFLSEEARKNIKDTLASRFRATENSYNNLYRETERRINLIGNTDKGSQLLNNYGGAFIPQDSNPSEFVGPVVSNAPPEQILTTPETQGWWNKTTNWLFGND